MRTNETLYLTVDEAAAYAGVGQKYMRDLVNSSDPPPLMRIGKRCSSSVPLWRATSNSVRRFEHETTINNGDASRSGHSPTHQACMTRLDMPSSYPIFTRKMAASRERMA